MKMKKFYKHALSVAVAGCLIATASTSFAARPTSSGLDAFSRIIAKDQGLQKRTTQRARKAAIAASNAMHAVILEGIYQTGVANDNKISTADARELNDYIYANYHRPWVVLHGDDKGNKSWGFHKVVNDGAKARMFNQNAINTVGDGIYHLGYASHLRNRLLNEDGNANQTYKDVGRWMDRLLMRDKKALKNPNIKEVKATTNTGLDQVVDMIKTDAWVQENASTGDIRKGITVVNEMNNIILDAIDATNVAADGHISEADAKKLNEYISSNHQSEWEALHGDNARIDKRGYYRYRTYGRVYDKTGFHLIQEDGEQIYMYGKGTLGKMGDSLYHLGFASDHPHHKKTQYGRSDGKKTGDIKDIHKETAQWLNQLLSKELNEMKMTQRTENSPVDEYSIDSEQQGMEGKSCS